MSDIETDLLYMYLSKILVTYSLKMGEPNNAKLVYLDHPDGLKGFAVLKPVLEYLRIKPGSTIGAERIPDITHATGIYLESLLNATDAEYSESLKEHGLADDPGGMGVFH